MVDLVFTSDQALKRSILKKYPKLTPEQSEATYQDQKQYVGKNTEAVIAKVYEEYKKSL